MVPPALLSAGGSTLRNAISTRGLSRFHDFVTGIPFSRILRPGGTLARAWLPLTSGPPGLGGSLRQVRGKKTKTVVKLEDLPQGFINAEKGLSLEDEGPNEPAYPTVVMQARRNMQRFDNCVVLTRVGGFYEMYFEHAQEYGPLLNLKVASKKTSAGPVPMVSYQLRRHGTRADLCYRPASRSFSWTVSSRSLSKT
jgi:hypothetical protein